MKKNRYLPMALMAAAILSGCNTLPKNSSLAEAHSRYDLARANPQVANLASGELKQAGDTLNKADHSLSAGESAVTVNHLAHIAKQQIAIAQETAKRKTAEKAVAEADAKRNQVDRKSVV